MEFLVADEKFIKLLFPIKYKYGPNVLPNVGICSLCKILNGRMFGKLLIRYSKFS